MAGLYKKSLKFTPGTEKFSVHKSLLFWPKEENHSVSEFSNAKLEHISKDTHARPEKGNYRLSLVGKETVEVSFFNRLSEARKTTNCYPEASVFLPTCKTVSFPTSQHWLRQDRGHLKSVAKAKTMDYLKRFFLIWTFSFFALFAIFAVFAVVFGGADFSDFLKFVSDIPALIVYIFQSEKITFFHVALFSPFLVATLDLIAALFQTKSKSQRDLPSAISKEPTP